MGQKNESLYIGSRIENMLKASWMSHFPKASLSARYDVEILETAMV
jgi:hypothetical protein